MSTDASYIRSRPYVGKDGYVRTSWTIKGKRHEKKVKPRSVEDIPEVMSQLEQEVHRIVSASKPVTFADLAAHFEAHYLKPAVYVDGRKIDGVRSLAPARSAVNACKAHFGNRRLRAITFHDLRIFKQARLTEPTRHGKQRTIATVNRELSKLSRMLNIAKREGWIDKNPFGDGECLNSAADEVERQRILTREEEVRLLANCAEHLRPIVICAIDTGMRRGEIFSLRWRDVDFEGGTVLVQAFNTKAMRERTLPMSFRLKAVMLALAERTKRSDASRVFGITSGVKRSFTSARRVAGLLDVRFHDLRHTFVTRLVAAGMPLPEIGKLAGHTQPTGTYRYLAADKNTIERVKAILDGRMPV
jgi:integrase